MKRSIFFKSTTFVILCLCLGALAAAVQNSRRVTLESEDGRRESRMFDRTIESVSINKRLSDKPCRINRDWGWEGKRLWVDNGCRAEFEVRFRGHDDDRWPGDKGPRRTIRLESQDNKRASRYIGDVRDLKLTRKLSDKACIKGWSWGYDDRRLWVDRGCRADFEYWVRN